MMKGNKCAILFLFCVVQHVFGFNNTDGNSTVIEEKSLDNSTVSSRIFTFLPAHYDLQLRLFLNNVKGLGKRQTAMGKVEIFGVMQNTSNEIILHANSILLINCSSVQVFSSDNQEIPILNCTQLNSTDEFLIQLNKSVELGQQLKIILDFIKPPPTSFAATKCGLKMGYYYSTLESDVTVAYLRLKPSETLHDYSNGFTEDEKKRSWCSTVFPCLDDAKLKSTFQLTIIYNSSYVSVSSTSLLSSVPDPDKDEWTIDKYAKTPKMSAGLLSFAVGEFGYVQEHFGKDNKSIRVYAPVWEIHKVQYKYISQVASKLLTFYEEYFNSSVHLEKMDFVVAGIINLDFHTWGISFHDAFDFSNHFGELVPKINDTVNYHIIEKIAEPLTNQWIGDLWSPKFIGNYAVYEYVNKYIGWPIVDSNLEEFVNLNARVALNAEALLYRMMEGLVGFDNFREAIRSYSQKILKGESIRTQEFAQIVEKTVNNTLPEEFNVSALIESYLSTNNYPVVKVGIHNATHFKLSQEKMHHYKDISPESPQGNWSIPIKIQIGENQTLLMMKPNLNNSLFLSGNTSQDVLLIDPDVTGYFRVFYEQPLLHRIMAEAERNKSFLNSLARGRMFIDYFTFVEKGISDYQTAMETASFVRSGSKASAAELLTFLQKFQKVYDKFSAHPNLFKIQRFVDTKIESMLFQLDNRTQTEYSTLLKEKLFQESCLFDTPSCKEYAANLLSQWKLLNTPRLNHWEFNFPTGIQPGYMECKVDQYGGVEAYSFVMNEFERRPFFELQYLQALSCAQEPELIERFLNFLINYNNTALEQPEREKLFLAAIDANKGRFDVLAFITKNFDEMVEPIAGGYIFTILDVVDKLSKFYSTEEQLRKLQGFIETHKEEWVGYKFTNEIKNIRANIDWMEKEGKKVLQWINED